MQSEGDIENKLKLKCSIQKEKERDAETSQLMKQRKHGILLYT
jgi:hypothetical protein